MSVSKNDQKIRLLIDEIFIRALVIIFLLIGITHHVPDRLPYLFTSGLISGFYYGWYNDIIWKPLGRLKADPRYRGHQIWIHTLCGVIGGITLWMLLARVDFWFPEFPELSYLDGIDIFLFITSVLAFTGLLPRTLWFFANRGGNFDPRI